MLEVNLLDVAVVVFLLAFLARGLLRGLTREVGSLVGVVGGFALARHFQPKLEPYLEPLVRNPDICGIVAYALIFIGALLVTALLMGALRKLMSITLTSWIDHLLGGVAGLCKGLLVTSLIFYLLIGFFPEWSLVKHAQATPFFHSLTDYLRNFLPDAFTYNLPVRL